MKYLLNNKWRKRKNLVNGFLGNIQVRILNKFEPWIVVWNVISCFTEMLWYKTHYLLIFSHVSHKVFEAVIAWVNHDKDVRQEFMARLMEHVRLPLLPREYLVQVKACAKHMSTCSPVSLAWPHVHPRYKVIQVTKYGPMGRRTEHSKGAYFPISDLGKQVLELIEAAPSSVCVKRCTLGSALLLW